MTTPITFADQVCPRAKLAGLGSMTRHLDVFVGTEGFFGQLAEQFFMYKDWRTP